MKLYTQIAQPPSEPVVPQAITISTEVVIGVVVTLVLGGIKWLFDRAVNTLDTKLSDHEIRLKELEAGRTRFVTLEQRFENVSRSFAETQRLFQEHQKELILLRTEISKEYVRREDWIRFSSVIEAKLDALNRKMDQRYDNLLARVDND